MGIGPAFAIPKALKKAGLTIADVDLFEINEAFASQAVMSVRHLNIPIEKVNPNGGAIGNLLLLDLISSKSISNRAMISLLFVLSLLF